MIADHTFATPDGLRRYKLLRPAGSEGTMLPAILLLHGHGQFAGFLAGQAAFLGYRTRIWARLAEREGVMLIVPDGVRASDGRQAWNDCRADSRTNSPADDVGFLTALIDHVIAAEGADPSRIYAFGSSNGGGMVYRLAIEAGLRFAAIGTQSAVLPAHSRCAAPSYPLSVFLTHGTHDPITPYEGGAIAAPGMEGRGAGTSVASTMAVWRELAGLPDAEVEYRYPHIDPADATSTTRYTWGGDPAGLQVVFVKVEGGGHTAPALDEVLPQGLRQLIGEQSRDVDIAAEAWAFFRTKRRP